MDAQSGLSLHLAHKSYFWTHHANAHIMLTPLAHFSGFVFLSCSDGTTSPLWSVSSLSAHAILSVSSCTVRYANTSRAFQMVQMAFITIPDMFKFYQTCCFTCLVRNPDKIFSCDKSEIQSILDDQTGRNPLEKSGQIIFVMNEKQLIYVK